MLLLLIAVIDIVVVDIDDIVAVDITGPKFLMSAKKIINKRTSYYLISLLNQPEERGGDDIVGKVKIRTISC